MCVCAFVNLAVKIFLIETVFHYCTTYFNQIGIFINEISLMWQKFDLSLKIPPKSKNRVTDFERNSPRWFQL